MSDIAKDLAVNPHEAGLQAIDKLENLSFLMSRLAAMRGVAMPKHRIYLPLSHSTDIGLQDLPLDLKIKEVWLTLFPKGEAFQIFEIPKKNQLPLLWVSEDFNEVKILKGFLSNASITTEELDGTVGIIEKDKLLSGKLFYLAVGLNSADVNQLKFLAKDWFFFAIKKRKAAFFDGIVATFLISVLTLGISFFTMQVYDRVIPTSSYSTLIVMTVGVLIALILELITKELRGRILDNACKLIDIELSSVFFGKMLSIRMDARPNAVGTFASQFRQFEFVRNFMTSSTLFVLADMPFVLFFILIIWMIGGIVALVPLILVPISIFIGFFSKYKLGKLAENQLEEANQKNGLLIEAIDGIESIKSIGGEWKMLDLWKQLTLKSADKEFKIRSLTSIATSMSQTIQQFSYVSIIVVGAYAVGSGKITMGALLACTIISNRALSPISQIAGKILLWHHVKAALAGLDQMMLLESDRDEASKLIIPDRCKGNLSLEKINFGYSKESDSVIKDISLLLKPGDRIAVIGPVGSGKSTLIKILSGLYKPQSGNIFLDEVDMNHIATEFLRESIGYLTQDVRLFSGSLRYNLILGLPAPNDSVILDACKETGLIQLIKSHPKGLDLPIYEGGRGLSGGQKQLVGLTRMLISKPKILLLDEPTASMDGDLEQKVIMGLFRKSDPQSIILLSTHKLGLLNFVDRILVMDKGRIVVDGPRDEVINKLKASAKPKG
jgi:ATP-binding cassette subfamily C protein LapB